MGAFSHLGHNVKSGSPTFGEVHSFYENSSNAKSMADHIKGVFDLFDLEVSKDGEVVELADLAYEHAYHIAQEAISKISPLAMNSGEGSEPTPVPVEAG